MNHFQSNRLFDRVELHFFVLSLVCACLDKVFILTNEPCDCHICLIKKKIFFFFSLTAPLSCSLSGQACLFPPNIKLSCITLVP